MPVVNVQLSLLSSIFTKTNLDEIIEKLPYLGLDIEGIDKKNDVVRIEFNPNRPDFSSENGIIRALNGILDIETGLPQVKQIEKSTDLIQVDKGLNGIRPVIYGVIAKRIQPLSNQELLQLISMQEDLHNGLGRKRKKSSIGIHNYDALAFPLFYTSVTRQTSFIPLDGLSASTIDNILKDSEVGRKYSHIIDKFDDVPILLDSDNNVVSFPPIINGSVTKVDLATRNLFIEVTSTNLKSAKEIMAIFSYELSDLGFDLYSVGIDSPFEGHIISPDLKPNRIELEFDYINKILGLDLSSLDIINCLKKSRCEGIDKENGILECIIPSYRVDLFHPIDICEEVVIGYGVFRLIPDFPSKYFAGKRNNLSVIFEDLRDVLVGLEFLEIINPNILSINVVDRVFLELAATNTDLISLDNSKNSDFETMRPSLIPSLINTLSVNIHEKYPQKLFEIGKTFKPSDHLINENWSLCVAIAHNTTDYTEIKSVLESLMSFCFNKKVTTPKFASEYFLPGHSARIILNEIDIGQIGEVHPQVLENFNLRTLVTTFELNLSMVIEILDLDRIRLI